MIETVPNIIPQDVCEQFVGWLKSDSSINWVHRGEESRESHSSGLPGQLIYSNFYTYHLPNDNAALILNKTNLDQDTKDLYSFIQIQRYNPGCYIAPHQDEYNKQIRLFNLTSSQTDGLVCQDGHTLVKVADVAGQEIKLDPDAWHWIDPVLEQRFTMVIGT